MEVKEHVFVCFCCGFYFTNKIHFWPEIYLIVEHLNIYNNNFLEHKIFIHTRFSRSFRLKVVVIFKFFIDWCKVILYMHIPYRKLVLKIAPPDKLIRIMACPTRWSGHHHHQKVIYVRIQPITYIPKFSIRHYNTGSFWNNSIFEILFWYSHQSLQSHKCWYVKIRSYLKLFQ